MISVAVVAMMCICPFAVMADDSDAYDVTAGESGLSVKIDSMSEADINKLFNDTEQRDLARNALEGFTNTNDYTISDVKITKMTVERGLSSKVTTDSISEYKGMKQTFTMTFTASAKYDNGSIFLNREPFQDAIKAIGTNTTAIGDKFEVTVEATIYGSMSKTSDIVKNDAGNFVVTADKQKQYANGEYDITAKYIYTKDAQPANQTVEVKYTEESETSYDNKIDFNGVDPTKATADTLTYIDQSYVYASNVHTECEVNGDSNSKDYYMDLLPIAMIFGGDVDIVCSLGAPHRHAVIAPLLRHLDRRIGQRLLGLAIHHATADDVGTSRHRTHNQRDNE